MAKLNFIKNKYGDRLLGFQYYDDYGMISIPLKGKVPIIPNWQNSTETISPVYCDDNTGILCGSINDLLVLDIDVKDDGLEYWNIVSSKHKKINTPIVQTPSGGLHIYFQYDDDIKSTNRVTVSDYRLKKIGWDVISNKRQVVAPPSVLNNVKYKWLISLEESKIKKIPKWLKDILMNNS